MDNTFQQVLAKKITSFSYKAGKEIYEVCTNVDTRWHYSLEYLQYLGVFVVQTRENGEIVRLYPINKIVSIDY